MKVRQLIALLQVHDHEQEIMIFDGSNGSGELREINFGPTIRCVTEEDAESSSDCEGMAGKKVICLGYGCY